MKRTAARKKAVKPVAKAAKKKTALRMPEPAAPAAPHDSVEALVIAGAQALGLTLDPAWRANVALNLRLILRHAALVDEFPLPDDAEPAPVFYA